MHYRHTVVDLRVDRIPAASEARAKLERLLAPCTILSFAQATYPPVEGAYTFTWILAKSHAVFHTAPEHAWIEVVLATCDSDVDHGEFVRELQDWLKPSVAKVQRLDGGFQ